MLGYVAIKIQDDDDNDNDFIFTSILLSGVFLPCNLSSYVMNKERTLHSKIGVEANIGRLL